MMMKLCFWWVLFLFFSFGISERALVFMMDDMLLATEVYQYVVICFCLISLVILYPEE